MLCFESSNESANCRKWYLLALPSFVVYVGGLLLLLVLRFTYWHIVRKWTSTTRGDTRIKCNIHRYLVVYRLYDLAYARNKAGRILLLIVFTLSMASFLLYLLDVTGMTSSVVDTNLTWQPSTFLKADLAMNSVFSLHFLLRFVAASSKLHFWLSWPTAVDVATIPTCIMYLIYNEYWTGFRFLRASYILSVPDILQIGGLLRDNRFIQVARITLQFLTLWLVAAGFIHMFENHGDPWRSDFNGQNLTYGECVYFLIITSSTVGYGDVTCKTTLGRLFDVGFVFVGLAMFANVIPQLITILKIGSPYSGNLRLPDGRHHVLVTGNVTAAAADKFIKIFLHPDRHTKDLAVVFLHPNDPDLDFEANLKRMENVYYFRGSEMDAADLERVDLVKAKACIILADQFARKPDEEDSANIMRAIAIKNLSGQTRILIQLLLERNKAHLLNVPSWNDSDTVVCLDEFKLGCMAQSCWAPGFATLLSLLLTVSSRDCDVSASKSSCDDADFVYLRGVGFEIYSADLSSSFAGMSFSRVAELCFQHLQLVLLGVKTTEAECTSVNLNPGRNYAVRLGDRGIFVTRCAATAARASHYGNQKFLGGQPDATMECSCRTPLSRRSGKNRSTARFNNSGENGSPVDQQENDNSELAPLNQTINITANPSDSVIDMADQQQVEMYKSDKNQLEVKTSVVSTCDRVRETFDFTGMFYWQPKRPVDEAVLTINAASSRNFRNHVVVCVFGDPDSPPIGLRNFVMPLRSSNRKPHDLKTIVFIGDLRYLRREWEQIQTFPAIFIIPGSPMDRTILRAVKVNYCDMCVILSSKSADNTQMLMDKHAILCYLNVKSMKFGLFQDSLVKYALSINSNHHTSSSDSSTPAELISLPSGGALKGMPRAIKVSNNIPIIVDITIPENILILDDDLTHTSRTPLIRMHPFTCGRTFAGDVLDSVICAAYFNPDVLTLVRELVTGGCTAEADQIFAEGLGFCEGNDRELIRRNRNRARIYEFSLSDPSYSHLLSASRTYADVFLEAIRQFGYICLAVCRMRNCRRNSAEDMDEERMVLVSPPEEFQMQAHDKIICLQPVAFTHF